MGKEEETLKRKQKNGGGVGEEMKEEEWGEGKGTLV